MRWSRITEKYLFSIRIPISFSKKFVQPRDNRYLLSPFLKKIFYCFDQHEHSFTLMDVNAGRETRYFFENLNQPVISENQYNFYDLRFLRDNVRCSDNFAGNNHVYLHYADWRTFYAHLQCLNMRPLVEEEQMELNVRSQFLENHVKSFHSNREKNTEILMRGLRFVNRHGQLLHMMPKLELDPALLEQPLYH